MPFDNYLSEIIDSVNGYRIKKRQVKGGVSYDILTEEARDYRFVFREYSTGIYLAKLGYKEDGNYKISQIKDDFYDAEKLVNTLITIFGSFYEDIISAKSIVYKFQRDVDNSYKLMVYAIFKKYLSKNYKIIDVKDSEADENDDFGSKKCIVMTSNRYPNYKFEGEVLTNILSEHLWDN